MSTHECMFKNGKTHDMVNGEQKERSDSYKISAHCSGQLSR